LFADKERGAEIYSAAADSGQAAIVFNIALDMVMQSPELSRRCKVLESTKRIILNKDRSFYRVLSAEHHSKHGFNAHGVFFDELHTQKTRHLWDVLTTSGGTRVQPLTYAITTAGFDKKSICYEQYDYAKKLLRKVITDKTFFPIIYELEKEDDWKDEKLWVKANPGLDIFRDRDEMRILYKKALVVPSLQNTFRRLYCNQWTEQETKWISTDNWNACKTNYTEKDLEGKICYAGLDLASTLDIAAFVMVFDINSDYYVLPYFWCPEEKVYERYEKGETWYKDWVDAGYMYTTSGNVIDYRYIRKTINDLRGKFNIREIAFDRWGATETVQYLEDDGFQVVMFGQGFASMAAPTKELLRVILTKLLKQNNNPVMNWMIDNVVVRFDPAGEMKPDKAKSGDKIDGVVALIMGLDRAMRHKNDINIYAERGVMTV
jgi:phage terminase large subunit-like protein